MGGAARQAAVLFALISIAACSNMAMPSQDAPPVGPDPGYGKLVANRLKSAFKSLPPSATVEISEPRWVHTMIGWNWLTCVRFLDQGHRRTYALYMNDNSIVDARYAVQTDGCGGVTYSSLDLASGAIRPAGTGDQGPIY